MRDGRERKELGPWRVRAASKLGGSWRKGEIVKSIAGPLEREVRSQAVRFVQEGRRAGPCRAIGKNNRGVKARRNRNVSKACPRKEQRPSEIGDAKMEKGN